MKRNVCPRHSGRRCRRGRTAYALIGFARGNGPSAGLTAPAGGLDTRAARWENRRATTSALPASSLSGDNSQPTKPHALPSVIQVACWMILRPACCRRAASWPFRGSSPRIGSRSLDRQHPHMRHPIEPHGSLGEDVVDVEARTIRATREDRDAAARIARRGRDIRRRAGRPIVRARRPGPRRTHT